VLLKMAYNLRTSEGRKNYRDLDTIKLPRAQRIKDKLYPVEIVGRDGDRVKVHYIGYSSQYDEWRLSSDLETLKIKDSTRGGQQLELDPYQPFDLHRELAYSIKSSLKGSRNDPEVRIDMPFHLLLFNGGLKQHGYMLHHGRGHEAMGIENYSDLTPLLVKRWYIRIVNPRKNFCYVNKETVQFWIHRKKDIEEFDDGQPITYKGGYSLVFKFVRMDGVADELDSVLQIQ